LIDARREFGPFKILRSSACSSATEEETSTMEVDRQVIKDIIKVCIFLVCNFMQTDNSRHPKISTKLFIRPVEGIVMCNAVAHDVNAARSLDSTRF